MKLKQILSEMIKKTEIKNLKTGDKIWLLYNKNRPAIEVEFVEFLAGDGFWKDRIKSKTTKKNIGADSNGVIEMPLSQYFLDDPQNEFSSTSKKGFLYKGIHGSRKWK